jgi:uncharacterized protein with FMN-binding domain
VNRIVLWVLSTLSSLVLLLGYHTSTEGPASAVPAVVGSTDSTGSGSTGSGSTGSGSTGSGSTGSGSTGSGDQVVTGSVASTQWGPVQVQLTISGGTITAVKVLQQPTGNPHDDQINSYALPVLVQETLDAQSADIDMVSGATVTSDGYQQSLQSALDQVAR